MAEPAFLPSEKLRAVANATEPVNFRQVPHNIEAEQALLGAILVNNEALDRVTDFLEPGHFYDPLHAEIYETATKLIQAGKQATPVTLKTFFENAEPIGPNMTVPQYLGRLAASATTISQRARLRADDLRPRHPAQSDRDRRGPRQRRVRQPGRSRAGRADRRRRIQTLCACREGQVRSGVPGVRGGPDACHRDGKQRLRARWASVGHLDGAQRSRQQARRVAVVRPHHSRGPPIDGQNRARHNIAYNVAKAYRSETQANGEEKAVDGAIVGFFSLEMSAEQLATRILSEQAEIPSEKIRRGMINQEEFNKLVLVSQEMSRVPLYIDQTGGITVAQLAARARKLKRQKGLGLLIIDYLQLLAGSAKSASAGACRKSPKSRRG